MACQRRKSCNLVDSVSKAGQQMACREGKIAGVSLALVADYPKQTLAWRSQCHGYVLLNVGSGIRGVLSWPSVGNREFVFGERMGRVANCRKMS